MVFEDVEAAEIISIVEKLNFEIYEQNSQFGEFYPHCVEFLTDGYSAAINFFDTTVWSTEDRERFCDPETGEYEPLEGYLRLEINKLIQALSKIKL